MLVNNQERGELPIEEGDVVREYKATHEEDCWSSWQREDEQSGEEMMARMKKKGVKRGREKRRKKRTKRELLEEYVRVLFLWKPLTFLVKGEIWRVVVIFLGKTPWRSLRTGLVVNLICVREWEWCLM